MFAYVNNVLLTIIRTAYYNSTTSLARQTYNLFTKYPSLRRKLTLGGYNWMKLLINAFVMGAVAVRVYSHRY